MSLKDTIQEGLIKLAMENQPFNPTTIDDPIAQQCSWRPAKGGGTNMGTHRLKESDSSRLEFKVNPGALIFPGVFAVVGFGVLIGMGVSGIVKGDLIEMGMGVLFGGIFALVGVLIMRNWSTPRIFDFSLGCYWKGRKAPNPYGNEWPKDSCRISDIHALQLLKERCTSSSSSSGHRSTYYSYEINLVFHDGQRLNVVDHGNQNHIIEDSEKLAQRLNVPVWRNF